MGEMLVLFACLNNTGCTETSSLYYEQNPDLKELVYKYEDKVKAAAGPLVVQYVAPLTWVATGHDATARLSTHFFITCKKDANIVQFKYDF